MKHEYSFKGGRRGTPMPSDGKERITIRLDKDVLEKFRERADREGRGGYQTLINEALRSYIMEKAPVESTKEQLNEERVREVVQDEIRKLTPFFIKEEYRSAEETPVFYWNSERSHRSSSDVLKTCMKHLVLSAMDKSDFEHREEFQWLLSDDLVSPTVRIVDSFANWTIRQCSPSHHTSPASKAFAEYIQIGVPVADIFDDSVFRRRELANLYDHKLTEDKVRRLSLLAFFSLLNNAWRHR